jgi:hypothetical protein
VSSTGHGLTGDPQSPWGRIVRRKAVGKSLVDGLVTLRCRCALCRVVMEGRGTDISMILPSGREPVPRISSFSFFALGCVMSPVMELQRPPRTIEPGGIVRVGRGGSSKGHRHLRFQSPCAVSSMAPVFRRISLALEASPFAP